MEAAISYKVDPAPIMGRARGWKQRRLARSIILMGNFFSNQPETRARIEAARALGIVTVGSDGVVKLSPGLRAHPKAKWSREVTQTMCDDCGRPIAPPESQLWVVYPMGWRPEWPEPTGDFDKAPYGAAEVVAHHPECARTCEWVAAGLCRRYSHETTKDKNGSGALKGRRVRSVGGSAARSPRPNGIGDP